MESEEPVRDPLFESAPSVAADAARSAQGTSASVHRMASDKMLPAICPSCQAPGTRGIPLPGDPSTDASATPQAYYCDICADRHLALVTRHLAWTAASALLIIAVVTALALGWGTRNMGAQILLGVGVAILVPTVLIKFKVWQIPELELSARLSAQGETLIECTNDRFGLVLTQHQIPRIDDAPRARSFLEKHRATLVLLTVFGAWFGLIHSLGGAKVRVIVAGPEEAILLVDSRHHERVAASNSEDPRAGIFTGVLGGRRHFEVVTRSGRTLGGVTKTIWPGRTYIVGHLPKGMCFFWERRGYGEEAGKSLFMPLGGEGPVWELRHAVDSWFVPLQAPEIGRRDGDSDWASSGGVRRAIRLLPCRAGLPHGAAHVRSSNGRLVEL